MVMLAMGIIGLFALLVMFAGGLIVLSGIIGLAVVTTIFLRQKIRERKENQQ